MYVLCSHNSAMMKKQNKKDNTVYCEYYLLLYVCIDDLSDSDHGNDNNEGPADTRMYVEDLQLDDGA